MQRQESHSNSTNYQCHRTAKPSTISKVTNFNILIEKWNFIYSDGSESGPGVPQSYSYDSMPDVDSVPAYGQPSYSSNRRREKRELVPGYGQTSVQSKCIEPPRNVHHISMQIYNL